VSAFDLKKKIYLAVAGLLVLGALGVLAWRGRAGEIGGFERLALKLNAAPRAEACDTAGAERRLRLARLLDKFHPRIGGLFETRVAKDFPVGHLEQVGPIFVRVSGSGRGAGADADAGAGSGSGFEVSSWSWEDAQGLFLRTQSDPADPETKGRWRDLDTSLRFLLEKDSGRLLAGKKYLPPQATAHRFWPNDNVRRTGPREFTVRIRAGDFAGAEEKLRRLLEAEWQGGGYRVRVEFTEDPAAYTARANFRSPRSLVHHREKVMLIANYAWDRTVAHELGHILGFDDHYYSVWHKENCYYTQESRVSDLMSNSEKGHVGREHWRLLERAYPWPEVAGPPGPEFSYYMGEAGAAGEP